MKKLKWPLIIFSCLFLIILSLSIYAYKKLGPDEIRLMAKENLEKEFPDAKVGFGPLSLNFGLVSKINLQNLEIEGKKSKLLSIEKLSIKIPFWSMLFGLGSIDVYLQSPEINYLEYKKSNNWELAKGKALAPKKLPKTDDKKSQTRAPGFLLKGIKVNIQILNLLAHYKLYKGKEGDVKVKNLEVINFNFKGPSKFKLTTELKMGEYSLDFEKEGTLNLAKSELKSKMSIKNLKVPSLKISKLENDIFFSWGQKKINGSLVCDLKKAGNLKLKIEKEGESLSLNALTGKLNLGELIESNSDLDFKDNILKVSGRIDISKSGVKPFLDIQLKKGPKLKKGKITTSFNAKIRGLKVNANGVAKLMGGHVTSALSGRVDFKKLDNLNAQGPFNLNVIAENLKVDPKDLAKKEKTKKGFGGKGKKSKEEKPMGIPRGKTTLRWKNIHFGPEKFNGMAIINTFPGKVDVSKLNFTLGKAKGNLKLKYVKNNRSQTTDVNFSVKRLNLKQFEPFFPEGINVVTGRMNSSVKGWAVVDKSKKYKSDLDFKVDVRNGKIKEFNLETHLRKIFSKTPFLTSLNKKDVGSWVTGDFDKLYIKGKQKSDTVKLQNFHMVGISKKIEIKGHGKLAEKKTSEIFLDFIDHKRVISGSVEKYTGKKAIPLKFKGIGYDLKPVYEYSVETLIKRSVNHQIKGTTKKLKKGLDKKLKNLFKF